MPKTFTDDEKRAEYIDADWLRDTTWRWVGWAPPHENWDHDHCFFCHDHFCAYPECKTGMRECWHFDYTDNSSLYETVCAACFNQLRDTFRWRIDDSATLY